MGSFSVPGAPVAWSRARRRGNRYFNERSLEDHKRLVAMCCKASKPYGGAVSISILCQLPIPKSWPKWKRRLALLNLVLPTNKPDADNFAKAVCDGLNGVLYEDDAQVVSCSVTLEYSEKPGTFVSYKLTDAAPANVTTKEEVGKYGIKL